MLESTSCPVGCNILRRSLLWITPISSWMKLSTRSSRISLRKMPSRMPFSRRVNEAENSFRLSLHEYSEALTTGKYFLMSSANTLEKDPRLSVSIFMIMKMASITLPVWEIMPSISWLCRMIISRSACTTRSSLSLNNS